MVYKGDIPALGADHALTHLICKTRLAVSCWLIESADSTRFLDTCHTITGWQASSSVPLPRHWIVVVVAICNALMEVKAHLGVTVREGKNRLFLTLPCLIATYGWHVTIMPQLYTICNTPLYSLFPLEYWCSSYLQLRYSVDMFYTWVLRD